MDTSLDKFIQLREKISAEGLLAKSPAYYFIKTLLLIGLFSLSLFLLISLKNFYFQILNLLFMVISLVQLGLIGHDIAHHQVFTSPKFYAIIGGFCWNFILGVSMSYWNHKHNAHHSFPNKLGADPDLGIPFVFSETQLITRPILKKFHKYQKLYFLPSLLLPYLSHSIFGIFYLIRNIKRGRMTSYIELCLLFLHHTIFIYLFFYVFPAWQALFFSISFYLLIGLYMGIVFAPNHKGMPVLEPHTPYSPVHQITTSRNIKPNLFIDFWYGGLNYQIEHHLFPTMPRNNLKKARKIVMDFCKFNNIKYHETNMLTSFLEIFKELRFHN